MAGKRTVLFLGNDAATGASLKAPYRAPVTLALIESFRGFVAQGKPGGEGIALGKPGGFPLY